MNILKPLWEKSKKMILKKILEIIVAIVTAAITALTTTSCMGHGPIYF